MSILLLVDDKQIIKSFDSSAGIHTCHRWMRLVHILRPGESWFRVTASCESLILLKTTAFLEYLYNRRFMNIFYLPNHTSITQMIFKPDQMHLCLSLMNGAVSCAVCVLRISTSGKCNFCQDEDGYTKWKVPWPWQMWAIRISHFRCKQRWTPPNI